MCGVAQGGARSEYHTIAAEGVLERLALAELVHAQLLGICDLLFGRRRLLLELHLMGFAQDLLRGDLLWCRSLVLHLFGAARQPLLDQAGANGRHRGTG